MNRGTYVHDLRHRFSLELRPDPELDRRLRALALELETRGLIDPGATSAPRFQPHLTLLRAARIEPSVAEAVARALARDGARVTFTSADTFGQGRIVYVVPTEPAPFEEVRSAAVELIDPDELDPLVHSRAWTPHITVAYAVPEASRAAALRHVRDALPVIGMWGSVQTWDLDVRPTRQTASASTTAQRGRSPQ